MFAFAANATVSKYRGFSQLISNFTARTNERNTIKDEKNPWLHFFHYLFHLISVLLSLIHLCQCLFSSKVLGENPVIFLFWAPELIT